MTNTTDTPKYQNTILKTLPPSLVDDYLAAGLFLKKNYNKNELIHIEGEPCGQIEIIILGEIVIERIGLAGDLMTVNHFQKGDVIGANLIFSSSENYPMTITAKKQTEVIVIEKAVLLELCHSHPAFLMEFVKIISDLSMLIVTKMKNRVSRTIRQSIVTYLNRQFQLQGSTTIQLTMSKKSLAEMFGVSRTSLSRELQKMADEKIIAFDARSIKILDQGIIE